MWLDNTYKFIQGIILAPNYNIQSQTPRNIITSHSSLDVLARPTYDDPKLREEDLPRGFPYLKTMVYDQYDNGADQSFYRYATPINVARGQKVVTAVCDGSGFRLMGDPLLRHDDPKRYGSEYSLTTGLILGSDTSPIYPDDYSMRNIISAEDLCPVYSECTQYCDGVFFYKISRYGFGSSLLDDMTSQGTWNPNPHIFHSNHRYGCVNNTEHDITIREVGICVRLSTVHSSIYTADVLLYKEKIPPVTVRPYAIGEIQFTTRFDGGF